MVDNDNAEITLLVLKVKVFKLRNMPDIFTHTLFINIILKFHTPFRHVKLFPVRKSTG